MTAIVGQNLPDPAMAASPARRSGAGDAEDTTAFGDMLAGRKPHPAQKPERDAAQRGEDTDPAGLPAGDDGAGTADADADAARLQGRAARPDGGIPLRDRFPLLTALQHLAPSSETESDKAADAEVTDEETSRPVDKSADPSVPARRPAGKKPATTGGGASAGGDAALAAMPSTSLSAPAMPAGPARPDTATAEGVQAEKPAVREELRSTGSIPATATQVESAGATALAAPLPLRDRTEARDIRRPATATHRAALSDSAAAPQARIATAPLPPNAAADRGSVFPAFDAGRQQGRVSLQAQTPSPDSGAAAGQAVAAADAGDDAATGSARALPLARTGALQRANVVAEQSFPAPAAYAISRTASELVGALAADPGWRQAAAAPVPLAQPAPAVAVPAHALKIELHPAELGVVTASLRMAGEQLSIEIRPQTGEAYRRLSADSEAIVRSLRGLGFDIDRVTVLQPALAATPSARVDGTGQPAMEAGRDQPSFQPGGSGGGADKGGRQWGGDSHDHGQDSGRAAPNPGPNPGERAGGGLFI